MGLMKKDMGGAANVLGLAHMIMAEGLPLRLRVLIPAVENAVAGNAFRPGDILTARDGQTIEINNTDAEGRLVLADALALASEEEPDLLVSMATLTGAARVAVGADIAPFYTDDEALAAALSEAAREVADPVWRLPFHAPYEKLIEPGIADPRQRAQGRVRRLDHRCVVPAPLYRAGPRLCPFRHLRVVCKRRARAPQGRAGPRRARAFRNPSEGPEPMTRDPRMTPSNGRYAHVSLQGEVEAESFVEGGGATG